jgi:DNA-directed RNA polymerase subunit RPC12/RpoP
MKEWGGTKMRCMRCTKEGTVREFFHSDRLVHDYCCPECKSFVIDTKWGETKMRCMRCTKEGTVREFLHSDRLVHDYCCPECKSFFIDTSDILRYWAMRSVFYPYGDNNSILKKTKG